MSPDAYLEMSRTEASHWWFRGRRRILSTIIDGLALPRRCRILEVGSGTGGNLEMLADFGEVSAFEMDANARRIAQEKTHGRFEIREGHCPREIPFEGERFDLICLFDVLEHIDKDTETLAALGQRLAPGGRIVLTVPAGPRLWSKHDEFLHHKRRYTRDSLQRTIARAGLNVMRISHFNTILYPLAVVARLKDRFIGSQHATGTSVPAMPINNTFEWLFSLERLALARVNLPFGVSLLAIVTSGTSGNEHG